MPLEPNIPLFKLGEVMTEAPKLEELHVYFEYVPQYGESAQWIVLQ
jgi:hypothetical protein